MKDRTLNGTTLKLQLTKSGPCHWQEIIESDGAEAGGGVRERRAGKDMAEAGAEGGGLSIPCGDGLDFRRANFVGPGVGVDQAMVDLVPAHNWIDKVNQWVLGVQAPAGLEVGVCFLVGGEGGKQQ